MTSFKSDIVPLFTQQDITHMSRLGVSLNDYGYMSQPSNAQNVYTMVSTQKMPPPPEGPWPDANVTTFKNWMDEGYPP